MRVLAHCSERHPALAKVETIAAVTGITEQNIFKLIKTLTKAGFVETIRGPHGGVRLAMPPKAIRVGQVIRAIARYNTNDFWALLEYENALPWESSIYVPKAIAAAIVGHNREVFGFGKLKAEKPERWDDVTVPTSVTFGVIAKAAG